MNIDNAKIQRSTLTVKELGAYLGIGLNGAYKLAKQPGFPAVRVSARRIIVPLSALQKWLSESAPAR